MNECAFEKVRVGAAGFLFARGASRSEAMELILCRGSRQSKQPLGRLPSRDREVLPSIPFLPIIVSHKECLETDYWSIAVSADVGSFGSPELGFERRGGHIRHLIFLSRWDLMSLRLHGRDENIKIACVLTLPSFIWRAFREGISAGVFCS